MLHLPTREDFITYSDIKVKVKDLSGYGPLEST
jgi:hypothetical protein